MNKRIERLCELCREVDKACTDAGAIRIGGSTSGEVHLTKEAFFKYFDKYEENEDFNKTFESHRYFYRNVDDIHFFCLVRKGDVDYERKKPAEGGNPSGRHK